MQFTHGKECTGRNGSTACPWIAWYTWLTRSNRIPRSNRSNQITAVSSINREISAANVSALLKSITKDPSLKSISQVHHKVHHSAIELNDFFAWRFALQSKRPFLCYLVLFAIISSACAQPAALAKKKTEADDQADSIPMAVVTGLAGEHYVFYGTGGIVVDQTPRPGAWHSNMRTYKVSIDGSNAGCGNGQGVFAGSNFAAANIDHDFRAVGNTAYFVSSTASCTLPDASGFAGREILVCNTSKDGVITYATTNGGTISGKTSGEVRNNTPNKVDRFISDGKNWYQE